MDKRNEAREAVLIAIKESLENPDSYQEGVIREAAHALLMLAQETRDYSR